MQFFLIFFAFSILSIIPPSHSKDCKKEVPSSPTRKQFVFVKRGQVTSTEIAMASSVGSSISEGVVQVIKKDKNGLFSSLHKNKAKVIAAASGAAATVGGFGLGYGTKAMKGATESVARNHRTSFPYHPQQRHYGHHQRFT